MTHPYACTFFKVFSALWECHTVLLGKSIHTIYRKRLQYGNIYLLTWFTSVHFKALPMLLGRVGSVSPACIVLTTAEPTVLHFVQSQTHYCDFCTTSISALKESFFRKLNSSPPDLTAHPRRLPRGCKHSEYFGKTGGDLPVPNHDAVTDRLSSCWKVKDLFVQLKKPKPRSSPFLTGIIH